LSFPGFSGPKHLVPADVHGDDAGDNDMHMLLQLPQRRYHSLEEGECICKQLFRPDPGMTRKSALGYVC
jgi:hypothetical protein